MSGQPASKPPQAETSSRTTLDYHDGYLCVMSESGIGPRDTAVGLTREWYPLEKMSEAEARALTGRPLRGIDRDEGLYVDEQGHCFQLKEKGKTPPLDSTIVPGTTTEPGEVTRKSAHQPRRGSAAELNLPAAAKARPAVRPASADRTAGGASEARRTRRSPGRLEPSTLAEKLAQVRRRIGYIQKRGHNELFGYSYAMAADIAGAVGDALAELRVVVIPRLASIVSEPLPAAKERVVRVVMDYTLIDAESGERETIRVAGEGRDPGDKGPYKAMTGALKYALLQAFLIATGDDPENERADGEELPRPAAPTATIGPERARALAELLASSGTELERVLEYFKVPRLEDLSEAAHLKALNILGRKRGVKGLGKEASHAQG